MFGLAALSLVTIRVIQHAAAALSVTSTRAEGEAGALFQTLAPSPEGFARWSGPLLAEALGDVDVQYVWRFLRSHEIDLAARKS